jgi:hypothetical protein
MPSPGNHDANTNPTGPALLALTWHFTDTYRHTVPLDAVAAAVGRTADALAADHSALIGVVGDRLADLLTGYQTPQRTIDVPDVEITDAQYDDQPSLTALFHGAHAAMQAEADTAQRSTAGLALAALLAGPRREGITRE